MKALTAIPIGIFGVIAGYFIAIALLLFYDFLIEFFGITDYGLFDEPVVVMGFIIVVTLLGGPLSIYLCIMLPRLFLWLLNREKQRPRRCQQCGYDLFGSSLTRCPECGKPVPIEQRQKLARAESPPA